MPDFAAEDRPTRLGFLRDDFIKETLTAALMAVGLTAIVVTVFDWDLKDTLLAAIGGAVIAGAVTYPSRMVKRLPSGDVPAPPGGAFIERGSLADEVRGQMLWALPMLPFLFALAWFADKLDSGGLVLPGFVVGDMLASLAAVAVAGRWEARHGKRLFISEDDKETLYAESLGARPDLLSVGGVPSQGPIHPR
jgi:hypothetical protein